MKCVYVYLSSIMMCVYYILQIALNLRKLSESVLLSVAKTAGEKVELEKLLELYQCCKK